MTALRGADVALTIGQRNPALDRLLQRLGAHSLCCVTAWNPKSRRLQQAANEAASRRMAARLARLRIRWRRHSGQPARGGWPAERGFALLDCPKEKAERLIAAFGQFGLVYAERGRAPELILTRLAR